MPFVSVVMPTYNYGRFIKRALNSVLVQTYQNYEIIVVDDASDDDTKDIVNQYHDQRIKYIKHNKNYGPSQARNTGIKASQGTYIAFLDSDDVWMPDKLEAQINVFMNGPENLGLVHTSMQTFDEKTQKISVGPSHPYRGQVLEDLLRANQVGNSSVMIKREYLDKAGDFDVSMRGCEDWDMWIRVSRSCLFEFIDKELVIFTAHSSNSSADMRRMISGREIMLNKFFSLYRLYPDIHALQHYIIGIQCFKEEMMERGRGHFTMAFKYSRPGNISIKCRSAIQIFLSLSGFRSYQKIKKYVHSHFLYLT